LKVEISFTDIDSLKVATRVDPDEHELKAIIQFEVAVHPGDVARLLNLQRQFKSMYCNIGSQQAEMELVWKVNKVSAEIEEGVKVE
jgi:hypothetical protein